MTIQIVCEILESIFFFHYSHWMSNFQPSSSASDGDIWLYALHDKYFPASARLKVIDNVLVVWLPSLEVCNEKIKINFISAASFFQFFLLARKYFFFPWRARQWVAENYMAWSIPSNNKSNFLLDMLLRREWVSEREGESEEHKHIISVVYQSLFPLKWVFSYLF